MWVLSINIKTHHETFIKYPIVPPVLGGDYWIVFYIEQYIYLQLFSAGFLRTKVSL